jgi:hypothetical protein
MPNLRSRNHSGTSYWESDSQVGWNLPGAIGSAAVDMIAESFKSLGIGPGGEGRQAGGEQERNGCEEGSHEYRFQRMADARQDRHSCLSGR